MGTAADKLQAVLNSKNAIKNKFNLADDLPFSQYAENINTAPGGIVIPENFNPASSADVWWNKQFFNCRGELHQLIWQQCSGYTRKSATKGRSAPTMYRPWPGKTTVSQAME